eukprot:11158200-Heterocapsa_arctica.AAC.1
MQAAYNRVRPCGPGPVVAADALGQAAVELEQQHQVVVRVPERHLGPAAEADGAAHARALASH